MSASSELGSFNSSSNLTTADDDSSSNVDATASLFGYSFKILNNHLKDDVYVSTMNEEMIIGVVLLGQSSFSRWRTIIIISRLGRGGGGWDYLAQRGVTVVLRSRESRPNSRISR